MSEQPQRIQVSFVVDVDVEALARVKKTIEGLRPGSADYCVAWDELKTLRQYHEGRLDGECAAYMNIAKKQIEEIFSVDPHRG